MTKQPIDVEQNIGNLQQKMKLFINLVNSVIYESQVNLMLNSLNYENFEKLYINVDEQAIEIATMRRG